MKRSSFTASAASREREGERPREPILAAFRHQFMDINAESTRSATSVLAEAFFAASVFLCAFALKKDIQLVFHLNEGITS